MGLKHPKNAIITDPSLLEGIDILDMFQTIFIIDDKRDIKRKNVIYRENTDTISELFDIDLIMISVKHHDLLKFFSNIWRKSKSILYIQGPVPQLSIQNLLYTEHYELSETNKDYTIWKPKK